MDTFESQMLFTDRLNDIEDIKEKHQFLHFHPVKLMAENGHKGVKRYGEHWYEWMECSCGWKGREVCTDRMPGVVNFHVDAEYYFEKHCLEEALKMFGDPVKCRAYFLPSMLEGYRQRESISSAKGSSCSDPDSQ